MDTILKSEYRCSLSTFSDDETLSIEPKQKNVWIICIQVICGRPNAHWHWHENTWGSYMGYLPWVMGIRVPKQRGKNLKIKKRNLTRRQMDFIFANASKMAGTLYNSARSNLRHSKLHFLLFYHEITDKPNRQWFQ